MIYKMKRFWNKVKKVIDYRSIQFKISASFTMVTLLSVFFIGIVFYTKFADKTKEATIKATEQLLKQTNVNLETYLRNMMRISDSMYYSVIKDKDISSDAMDTEMNLLYEVNKDNLVSIACFKENGELVAATPVANYKSNVNVTTQEWFLSANKQMENLHFSAPHVQNIFDDNSFRYYWVVSLSRMVELTSRGNSIRGVLLVDMNFSGIEQLFKKSNASGELEYIYLVDSQGNIIYHPKQILIDSNVVKENNLQEVNYEDGSHYEVFDGERRIVTVKTVAYTGWKIIYVTPYSTFNMTLSQTRFFVILIITAMMILLIFVNQFVSAQIAKPIKRLNNSVMGLENGNLDVVIYEGGGSEEVRHLGKSLNLVVAQLKKLMEKIVFEQEEKRKSELDALQSQINPHFLYNTLDSIVWMIEGERYQDAICMVTDLASLFRISLSRGKNIISIRDEIMHAKNYMNIQKIRYKDAFEVYYEIEEEIFDFQTVKLVIQPLLENAIYYGVEAMYDEGEITLRGYRKGDDIFIEVIDNGLGMTPETVEGLLTNGGRKRTKGSGVGLKNVHSRIQLRYGANYGLFIDSQPDEGTKVTIHLPAIPYSEISLAGGQKNEPS
ncbi:MAG: two-component system, sensor histidine kinase YesM [Clostridiales bacterium]|nr:two-component system, sensor histidine kinase YesM [Clostridiales bacterium]